MSKQASYCDECKHFIATLDNYKEVCGLGHKPRFYKPLTLSQAHSPFWGWKRICSDYQFDPEQSAFVESKGNR